MYKVTGVPAHVDPSEVVEIVRGEIEQKNDYFCTDIIGYGIEDDNWMSDFELSQLNYDGASFFIAGY